MSSPTRLFSFPNPVNELAARVVGAGVVLQCVLILTLQWPALIAVLCLGFWARVLTGPKLSVLGLLATKVIVPRLPVKGRLVAGPPKRFAQGIGAGLSTVGLALSLTGHAQGGLVAVGAILVAATLESVFAYCLGCKIFVLLMRVGLIPAEVCEACNAVAFTKPVSAPVPERTSGQV